MPTQVAAGFEPPTPNRGGGRSDRVLDDATLLLDLSQSSQNPSSRSLKNAGKRTLATPQTPENVNENVTSGSGQGSQQPETASSVPQRYNDQRMGSLSRPGPAATTGIRSQGKSGSDAVEPGIRSPDSNEALAELLQQGGSSISRPSNASLTASHANLEEFSNLLTSELASCLNSSKLSAESIRSIIDSRMTALITSSKSRKRTYDEALLDDSAPKAKRVSCSTCSKTMDRQCDLKKHEKRHSRPWGCTNTMCNKSFGSKNDWKRHENSQHYQLETWRCHEESSESKINQCAKIFFRRDPFQAHLRKDHGIHDDEYIREQCRQRRIGRNWQNGFWCGFCKQIVKLNTKGLEAWDERFNHIDDQHFKQGRNIDEWYPMDKDLPKGKLKLVGHSAKSLSREANNDSDSDSSDFEGVLAHDAGIANDHDASRSQHDRQHPETFPDHSPSAGAFAPQASQGRTTPDPSSRASKTKWYCVSDFP